MGKLKKPIRTLNIKNRSDLKKIYAYEAGNCGVCGVTNSGAPAECNRTTCASMFGGTPCDVIHPNG